MRTSVCLRAYPPRACNLSIENVVVVGSQRRRDDGNLFYSINVYVQYKRRSSEIYEFQYGNNSFIITAGRLYRPSVRYTRVPFGKRYFYIMACAYTAGTIIIISRLIWLKSVRELSKKKKKTSFTRLGKKTYHDRIIIRTYTTHAYIDIITCIGR